MLSRGEKRTDDVDKVGMMVGVGGLCGKMRMVVDCGGWWVVDSGGLRWVAG